MKLREGMSWEVEAPEGSPLKGAQLRLGEGVWGDNHLRLVVQDQSGEVARRAFAVTVMVTDAAGKSTYAERHDIEGLAPCLAAGGPEKGLPGVFGAVAKLGIQRHADYALTESHFQAFLPYRVSVTRFPGTVAVRLRDAKTGADLGCITRRFPAFGYVRLHVARCNPFEDERQVPALLRLWLDKKALPGARVRLRLAQDPNGRSVREEVVKGLAKRDLRFRVNLDGLGAGRYRLDAELLGVPGLSAASSSWIEKRPLPKAELRVPLVCDEVPGVSRSGWPATGGVPIPDGALAISDIEKCRVVDADGNCVQAQFRVLATWAENRRFVRWLLVDTQAHSRDGAVKPLALVSAKKAPAPVPQHSIRMDQTPDGFRVDTGPLVVDFRKRSTRFVQQMSFDANADGRHTEGEVLLSPDGLVSAYMALLAPGEAAGGLDVSSQRSPNLRCEVEETGPLRTVIRVHGAYGEPAGAPDAAGLNEFTLRFTFWAGRPELGVEHTFLWKEDPQRYVIDAYGLHLPIAKAACVLFPGAGDGEENPVHHLSRSLPWSVRQSGSRECLLGGQTVSGRFPGWIDVQGEEFSTAVLMHDFWQQFPAGVRVDERGIDLQCWPPEGEPLDLRNTKETWFRGNGVGVAKTHRFTLCFHQEPWKGEGLARWAFLADEPARIAASPEAVLASRALGPLHPHDRKRFPDDEKALENIFRGLELQPAETGVFGCMNWGDLHSRWDRQAQSWSGYRYWLNNEAVPDALTFSLWLQYVRTASRRYFKFCERRTCHLMDVDFCHYSRNQPLHFDGAYPRNHVGIVGLQHRHTRHHWSGACCIHHTTYGDIALYHLLTGRWRAYEVLAEAAGSMKTFHPSASFVGSYREVAVPFRLMGDLYWLTWDYDFWRLAVELHDRMVTYSWPGGRGLYGYLRYVRFTGDRRYGQELLTRAMIHGRELPASPDADWSAPEHRGSLASALNYEITGDRRAVAGVLRARKIEGTVSNCVRGPLLKNHPDEAARRTPPGYDWPMMSAFTYAYAMESMVRAGVLEERTLQPPIHTNGKGGGKWSEPATFRDGRRPDPETPLVIENEDTLLYNGQTDAPNLAGLTVRAGAVLALPRGKHTLIVRGNVQVDQGGAIRMGAGASLKIDSDLYAQQYGITLAGRIEAQGSSAEERDCYLGSHTHGTYLNMVKARKSQSYGFLRNCTVRGCQIQVASGGFELTNCRLLNGSLDVKWIHELPLTIQSNEIEGCFLKFFQAFDLRFEKNKLLKTQMYLHPERGRSLIRGNLFKDAGRAVWIVSSGDRTKLNGNTYQGAGVYIQNSNSTLIFRKERFHGHRDGLRIASPVTVVFEDCAFAKLVPRQKSHLDAGPARVWLKGCRFEPEAQVQVGEGGGVRSENHNGKPGRLKTWGRALPPIEVDAPSPETMADPVDE